MILRKASLFFLLVFFSLYAFAQDEPVLFTINDNPVYLSEFTYIYEKNNGDNADYSKESLDEYIDLYKKFKLKVEQAKYMGLDTVKRLQAELEGYRKQLASNYLVDKEVSEKLIAEVMERVKYDVKLSHIFVATPPKASSATRATATDKINRLYQQLESGVDFAELAKRESEDKATAIKGGELGYHTAMLPNGFYELENAMYSTAVGNYTKPFQSKMGMHIVKVLDKREARGELDVSHILIKSKKDNAPVKGAKFRADSIKIKLDAGADFAEIAKQYSEDKNTNSKGGKIGYFKINQFESTFEDAAHALKDGEYSDVIETRLGWHIIKRHNKKDESDPVKLKRKIQAGLVKADRFEIAKKKLIEKIEKEAGVAENSVALNQFISSQNEDFYSYKWQIPENLADTDLMTIGKTANFSVEDFAKFCKKDTKSRLRFNKNKPIADAVNEMYDNFKDEKILAYEESQLANKYPEFKSLMREYEEGILLFEATKMEVWDKASSDTVGLKKFHDKHKSNYKWEDRIEVNHYSINTTDAKTLKAITKAAKKSSTEDLIKKYNTDALQLISYESRTFEKSSEDANNYNWSKDFVSDLVVNEEDAAFYKVVNMMPAQEKTLKEARGYIIADYQDFLEKEWIEALRKRFKIKVNEKVLKSLIK